MSVCVCVCVKENLAKNDSWYLYLQISSDMLSQCHFNYMEESVPVPLEKLGTELKQDWRGYMFACTTALLKEGREK